MKKSYLMLAVMFGISAWALGAVVTNAQTTVLDGYSTGGTNRTSCQPHDADYDNNWGMSLQENVYFARLYNAG